MNFHKGTQLIDKTSLSLTSMLRRRLKELAPTMAIRAAGFHGHAEVVQKEDLFSVLIEASDDKKL